MFKIFSFLLYSHSFTCISTLPWQLLFQNGASCYGLAQSHKPSLLIHQFFSSNGLLFKTKEGARTFYQILVPIYQTAHCHIPRVHNFIFLSLVVAIPGTLYNLVTSSKSLKNILQTLWVGPVSDSQSPFCPVVNLWSSSCKDLSLSASMLFLTPDCSESRIQHTQIHPYKIQKICVFLNRE